MANGRRFQVGVLLIVVGVALIALNLWFLSTLLHWAGYPGLSQRDGRYAGPGIVGLTLIVAGVMALLGC